MKNVVLLENAYPHYSTPYFVYTEYLGPRHQAPIISPGPPALSLQNTAQLDPRQQAEARGSRGFLR